MKCLPLGREVSWDVVNQLPLGPSWGTLCSPGAGGDACPVALWGQPRDTAHLGVSSEVQLQTQRAGDLWKQPDPF